MDILTNVTSISGKIETIIKESESKLFLISPYIQLDKQNQEWTNIKSALQYALDHNIEVHIIVRHTDDKNDDFRNIFNEFNDDTHLHLHFVENLHTKLYYNGKEALISTMNLYYHSSLGNHELGVYLKISSEEESMNKLKKYIDSLLECEVFEKGYCIRCKEKIVFEMNTPFCKKCFKKWSKWKNRSYTEKYCHYCGKLHNTSQQSPLCKSCYYELKDRSII